MHLRPAFSHITQCKCTVWLCQGQTAHVLIRLKYTVGDLNMHEDKFLMTQLRLFFYCKVKSQADCGTF